MIQQANDFSKRLEKHIERYIEEELKLYPTLKKSLQQLEQDYLDILHRGRQFNLIPGTSEEDKVSRAALRMREIEEESTDKTKRKDKVDRGIAILTNMERKYVDVAYFNFNEISTTYESIMEELHIGNRNKVAGIKQDALYKFAIIFNLV